MPQVLRVIQRINNAQNVNKQHARNTIIPCYQIFASVGALLGKYYAPFKYSTNKSSIIPFPKAHLKTPLKGSARIADK